MERHAVPQNIMEVEFKLFGALTIKQFAYLAAGFVAGLIIYFTGLPFILRLPLIIFAGVMGVALALLKINGQPASVFFSNFILAMFTSQQRVWKKSSNTPDVLKDDGSMAPQIEQQIVKKAQKETKKITGINTVPLSGLSRQVRTKVDDFEDQRLDQIDSYFQNEIKQVNSSGTVKQTIRDEVVPPAPPVPSAPVTPPSTEPAKGNLADEIKQSQPQDKREPIVETDNYSAPFKTISKEDVNPSPIDEDSQVNSQGNKKMKDIQAEIARLQKQMEDISTEVKEEDTLKELESEIFPDEEQIETTRKPVIENKVSGLVVDKKEAPVTDATVYIKDKSEKLVRKVVTGAKGDFALTNPLPNGDYYVDIEADGYKFGRYRITLDGEQLPYFKFRSK